MLYDRWREIVRDFRHEIALRDLEACRHWTFAELDSLAGTAPAEESVFPQGSAVDFITTALRGWKSGSVVCPLEPGQQRPEFPRPPGNIAHVKITSASTGPARFVAFTAEQLAADARNIIETMGLRRDWPNLGVISLAHSYGFSNLITPLLLHGIPLVVSSPLPGTVGAALQKIGTVTLPAVPALWRAWIDAGVLSASTVRLAISAGAPLPVPLEAEIFERSGIKLHNFYGSTECGGIAFDSSETPRNDPGYAGLPMRRVDLSIAADGCLEVRGDAVGETYWPAPDKRLGRGCFRTTDVAEIIDAGVYLRGRASDVINIAGRKISPESIENTLLRHPLVRQCVVFSVPESDRDRIVACVAAGASTSSEQLRHFLLEHLPAWQVPREFWMVRELPVDHRGKISRASLRAQYQKTRA